MRSVTFAVFWAACTIFAATSSGEARPRGGLYLVVDLSGGPSAMTYPVSSLDAEPQGGWTDEYKTTKLVLRRIPVAKIPAGDTWTMGTISVESDRYSWREASHKVTLTNNYYIGVFPVTQAQAAIVTNYAGIAINAVANSSTEPYYTVEGAMRPVERISYNQIRIYTMAGNGGATNNQLKKSWPNEPDPNSFLGELRSMTGGGIDFDLPSEAQWEFAARAGNGAGYWGDGTPILNGSPDANLNRIGRYKGNLPGDNIAQTAAPSEGGTPIVGSYAPNKWGLYDMQGCVWEWCLDWYQDDISVLNGAVNIKFDDPTQPATGTTMDGKRAARGGSMDSVAGLCRPGFRNAGYSANARQRDIGFRLVCTAGLK